MRRFFLANARENVDKPGSHNLPGGVDSFTTPDIIHGDRPDLPVQYTDVGDFVPPRLRVHHPAPEDDYVKGLLGDGRRRQYEPDKQYGDHYSDIHMTCSRD